MTALADEQEALRRVATLVAKGVPPAELFSAVTKEVAQLVPVAQIHEAGSGLVGLADRVEALSGSFRVSNSPSGGTQITAGLPLELEPTYA